MFFLTVLKASLFIESNPGSVVFVKMLHKIKSSRIIIIMIPVSHYELESEICPVLLLRNAPSCSRELYTWCGAADNRLCSATV